jgi:hypothetical protein
VLVGTGIWVPLTSLSDAGANSNNAILKKECCPKTFRVVPFQ